MEKKYILKEAGVLLIVALMVLSTIVVTADTAKEELDPSYIKTTSLNPSISVNTNVQTPFDWVMFAQRPFEPDEDWIFLTSSTDAGYIVYDNFWELLDDICDIHWWGLSVVYPWAPCDPAGMKFEIIFYEPSTAPGVPVCVYSDISPTMIPTGVFFGTFEMYYFETDLDPCCPLVNGWVSIQSTSSPNGCWFLWAGSPEGDGQCYQNDTAQDGDCAFQLTAEGPPPKALICCDPDGLDWIDVKPGDKVMGKIQVCNCGDPGSLLSFKVDSWPIWGTNWTFTPPSGVGIAKGDCVIVNVSVEAPMQKKQNFSGKIIIVNLDDPTDYCEAVTTLITPKNIQFFNLYLLNWLFEKFPNAFPILRYALGL